ncbi:MAG TPA: DMT family transporter [Terriglobales bacterium]|nr:DMT family transporter [Terriglobales bacterium]
MSRNLKAHILLVLITFFWGATFVIVKNALDDISPLLFNAVRMALASAIMVPVFWNSLRKADGKTWRAGAMIGFFLFLGYSFQTSGLRFTSPSKSAFLTGLSVVLVPVILAVVWRRLPSNWTTLGVISALVGLYLMTIPSGNGLNLASMNRGDLLTLGCACSFALQIIFMGRAMRTLQFASVATIQILTTTLLMLITAPIEPLRVVWSGQVLWAIAITGTLCTAAAFTIQAWAQQFTPPSHTALIFVLEPVFAGMTSFVMIHERLGFRATVGALLILGGILISELKGSTPEAEREIGSEIPIS